MIALQDIANPAIATTFARAPEPARAGMLALRGLILNVAADLPEAGRVEETLRWGQPSYITPDTKAGSTIRLGLPKAGGFALYVHCQTTLLSDFRALFGDDFRYEGNRAVLFDTPDDIKPDLLSHLIRNALTYHLK
ncbi:DUF1801 domain-containing protein [Aliiroseovarius sp. YM-037]|uniref:DUF1801 domain-containing protein n=1 Tax=Aliiroseovarius sp. YM-037 TaxID=3341728 RepID=UPI003A8032B7